jgi:hypothetical protein
MILFSAHATSPPKSENGDELLVAHVLVLVPDILYPGRIIRPLEKWLRTRVPVTQIGGGRSDYWPNFLVPGSDNPPPPPNFAKYLSAR